MRRISISDANEDDIIDAVATFFAHDYGHLFLSIGILAVILLIAVMLNGLGIRQGLIAFNVALFIYAAMKIRREHIVSFNSIFWFIVSISFGAVFSYQCMKAECPKELELWIGILSRLMCPAIFFVPFIDGCIRYLRCRTEAGITISKDAPVYEIFVEDRVYIYDGKLTFNHLLVPGARYELYIDPKNIYAMYDPEYESRRQRNGLIMAAFPVFLEVIFLFVLKYV